MERDINQQASTTLCRGGCGFFGSAATDGLCSKCFKDSLKRKQDPARLSPTSVTAVVSNAAAALVAVGDTHPSQHASTSISALIDQQHSNQVQLSTLTPSHGLESDLRPSASSSSFESGCSAASDSTTESGQQQQQSSPPKKKPNRCHSCNKRVGLTGFPCRCGGMFCGEHRYSDTHTCSFDYKALGAQEIRKNNPVVVSEKIQKL